MSESVDIKEILVQARGKIERFGHVQRSYGDERRGFCMVGAIVAATQEVVAAVNGQVDYMEVNAANIRARELLQQTPLICGRLAVEWNDAEGRTKQQVLEAFDQAISAAE